MNKNVLLGMLLVSAGILGAQTPTIPTPPQSDQIILDNNSNGKADPGDKIRYKVTVQNTGSGNATGVKLQANPDSRTTLNLSSFRSSPVAVNDGPYACTGNVGISIPAASGVKANDYDDALASATLAVTTPPTNGSVTLNNDGGFTYTPTAGFTGNDQFTYEISDVTAVAGHVPASTDIRGTVSIAVSNLIWFIDNSSVAATSDGRLNAPFKTLADFNASTGPQAGHLIFIKNTGTNYAGGIVLKNTQTLFGTGHTGGINLADVLPFALAANSFALPAINGTRPVITNTGGDGVTLAAGNTLRGFNVGNCFDFGIDNTGTNSVGNLFVSEVTINNTTGGGFDASHGSGASMNAVFDAISSNGGANGINLSTCFGTFTVNGGTITNPTGTGVLISGGTVAFSSSGAVTDNTGFAVDVDNHDSGNVIFSNTITSTGSGIRVQNCGGGLKLFSGTKSLNTGANTAVTLSSNSGATINFTGGGLAITTTSGTGFTATGGGTVTVQGTGNTISSTSATALNVANTTIGASGMTFQSISSGNNTAAADPVNGIVLNNTGASGGLTVTGNANTSLGGNSSGGTIQNTSGDGISLTNTTSPSFTNMTIQGSSLGSLTGSGIQGTTVTNFTFVYGTITNVGHFPDVTNTFFDESNIRFSAAPAGTENNLSGVVTITNNILNNATYHGVDIQNYNGTISDLNVSNNSLTSGTTTGGSGTSKGTGIRIATYGSASTVSNLTKASINNNTINNFPGGAGIQVQGGNSSATGTGGSMGTPNSGINIITITGNLIKGSSSSILMGTHAILVGVSGGNAGSRSQANVNISNNGTVANPLTNVAGIVIGIGNNGNATMTGTIDNNVIVANNTVGSGGISGGNGITNANTDTPDLTLTVTNNNISQTDGNGILLVGRGVSGLAKLSIKNNTVGAPLGGFRPGIRVDAGNSSSVDDAVCLDISGNTSGGSGGSPGIGVRKQGTVATTNDFGIEGLGSGACANVETYISGLNPGSVSGTAGCNATSKCIVINGDNYVSCNTAPN